MHITGLDPFKSCKTEYKCKFKKKKIIFFRDKNYSILFHPELIHGSFQMKRFSKVLCVVHSYQQAQDLSTCITLYPEATHVKLTLTN